MSIFKKEYTIHIDKSIDECKALFEKSFQDMTKKGYSGSTIIHHPNYGTKKFTGTVDNGIYKARLILSQETDNFYRNAPINEITFTGGDTGTNVKVSVGTVKYAVLFLCILAAAIVLLSISILFTYDLTALIPFVAAAVITAIASTVPLIVAKYRINAAKETLIYILKYNSSNK